MAHVIITGGSSGIGAALARASAARGDDVSLIARTEKALTASRESLGYEFAKQCRKFTVQSADVGDAVAVNSAIARCESELGPCDTLITSAGIVVPGRFESLPPEEFEAHIRTNLLGTVNAVRAVYPGMKQRRRGRILMMGSGLSLVGVYGYTAYCASKYAVAGFAEALRAEARTYGISISICFPPDTETPQLLAERSLRPPEAHVAIGAGGTRSADAVARAALSGLHRGQFAIYPGLQMKALGLFGSLATPLLRPWFDRRISTLRRSSKARIEDS